MKAENPTLTHDVIKRKSAEKEILLPISVHRIIDFTFPVGSFMLKKPEDIKEIKYKSFSLGEITGDLSRKDLYKDR